MTLEYYKHKDQLEVGVDEVARGCLFGRVYAAAVIWPQTDPDADPEDTFQHPPVRDSKTLSPKQRSELQAYIEYKAIDFAVAYADEVEVDAYNILQASQLAMHRALDQIRTRLDFDHILADGNYFVPYYTYRCDCIPKGDGKYYSIAAASVLAKVYHDKYIKDLVTKFPGLTDYGIEGNMGYGSKKHMEAIKKYGITDYHRKSFRPCVGVKIRTNLDLPLAPPPPVVIKVPKVKAVPKTKTIKKIVKKDTKKDTKKKDTATSKRAEPKTVKKVKKKIIKTKLKPQDDST